MKFWSIQMFVFPGAKGFQNVSPSALLRHCGKQCNSSTMQRVKYLIYMLIDTRKNCQLKKASWCMLLIQTLLNRITFMREKKEKKVSNLDLQQEYDKIWHSSFHLPATLSYPMPHSTKDFVIQDFKCQLPKKVAMP